MQIFLQLRKFTFSAAKDQVKRLIAAKQAILAGRMRRVVSINVWIWWRLSFIIMFLNLLDELSINTIHRVQRRHLQIIQCNDQQKMKCLIRVETRCSFLFPNLEMSSISLYFFRSFCSWNWKFWRQLVFSGNLYGCCAESSAKCHIWE